MQCYAAHGIWNNSLSNHLYTHTHCICIHISTINRYVQHRHRHLLDGLASLTDRTLYLFNTYTYYVVYYYWCCCCFCFVIFFFFSIIYHSIFWFSMIIYLLLHLMLFFPRFISPQHYKNRIYITIIICVSKCIFMFLVLNIFLEALIRGLATVNRNWLLVFFVYMFIRICICMCSVRIQSRRQFFNGNFFSFIISFNARRLFSDNMYIWLRNPRFNFQFDFFLFLLYAIYYSTSL